jgi:hypothetical protein
MRSKENIQNKAALQAIGGKREKLPIAKHPGKYLPRVGFVVASVIGLGAGIDHVGHIGDNAPVTPYALNNPTPSVYGGNVNKIIVSSPESKKPGQVLNFTLGVDGLWNIGRNILKDTPPRADQPSNSATDAVMNQEMNVTGTTDIDGWMEYGQKFSIKVPEGTNTALLAKQEKEMGTTFTISK